MTNFENYLECFYRGLEAVHDTRWRRRHSVANNKTVCGRRCGGQLEIGTVAAVTRPTKKGRLQRQEVISRK